MTRQMEPGRGGDLHLLQGAPVNATVVESLPRYAVNADVAAALVTQVMTSVAMPFLTGDTITNLTFLSGATAASVPTNWWFALYSPSGALLAQTADQLTAAWAADTAKTLPLQTAQTVTAPGIYWAAIMVKATTVPSLVCCTMGRAAVSTGVLSHKVIAQNSGSSLTTTAPGTIASPTAQASAPYCVAT